MLSVTETWKDQVNQTRNRKGLYMTVPACCALFPGFHLALKCPNCSKLCIFLLERCLVPREVSYLWGLPASQCYLSLPAQAAGSWLPTASLTPSSSPALLSLPKLLFLSRTRLFPDSSHLLRDAGSVFSKTGSTTENRSTKQTNAVYLRSAKLLFNKIGCELAKASPWSWLILAKRKYWRQDTRDAQALHYLWQQTSDTEPATSKPANPSIYAEQLPPIVKFDTTLDIWHYFRNYEQLLENKQIAKNI